MSNNVATITPLMDFQEDTYLEKRGTPTYNYNIGSDELPHYRVFFWIPKTATNLLLYADKNVNTDISQHGPVEKWSVVLTYKII